MDENDDMAIQESESRRSTICPVTQGEMEDPLRKCVSNMIQSGLLEVIEVYCCSCCCCCCVARVVVTRTPRKAFKPTCNAARSVLLQVHASARSRSCANEVSVLTICIGCPQNLSLNNLERDVEMEVIIARRYRI